MCRTTIEELARCEPAPNLGVEIVRPARKEDVGPEVRSVTTIAAPREFLLFFPVSAASCSS